MKTFLLIIAWMATLVVTFHIGTGRMTVLNTVTVRYDTIRIVRPEVMVIHTRGKSTERMPVADSSDSADVEIPVEQAIYSDSCYTAYVSGFRPRLDSLIFVRPEKYYSLPCQNKTQRWSIGIQAGYGITPRGPQPYVGLGIAFRIL